MACTSRSSIVGSEVCLESLSCCRNYPLHLQLQLIYRLCDICLQNLLVFNRIHSSLQRNVPHATDCNTSPKHDRSTPVPRGVCFKKFSPILFLLTYLCSLVTFLLYQSTWLVFRMLQACLQTFDTEFCGEDAGKVLPMTLPWSPYLCRCRFTVEQCSSTPKTW